MSTSGRPLASIHAPRSPPGDAPASCLRAEARRLAPTLDLSGGVKGGVPANVTEVPLAGASFAPVGRQEYLRGFGAADRLALASVRAVVVVTTRPQPPGLAALEAISRWLAGTSEPQGPALRQVASYFGLPMDTNLRRDPVFLSLEPVSLVAKRHWVRDRLDKLSEQDLQDLYPALRRMLDEDQ